MIENVSRLEAQLELLREQIKKIEGYRGQPVSKIEFPEVRALINKRNSMPDDTPEEAIAASAVSLQMASLYLSKLQSYGEKNDLG